MFDFSFDSSRPAPAVDRWGLPCRSSPESDVSDSSCGSAHHDLLSALSGGALANTTNVWQSNVSSRKVANAAEPPRAPSVEEGISAVGADVMLVKGNFLSAAQLLQLAGTSSVGLYNSNQRQERAYEGQSGDGDERRSRSPSRCSTPMSIANAVLQGSDDSPVQLTRQPTSMVMDTTTSSLPREYSTFSVCASSRDATPVSPSVGLSGVYSKVFPSSQPNTGYVGVTHTCRPLHPSPTNHLGSGSMVCVSNQAPGESSARRAVRSHHVPIVTPVQKQVIVELTSPQLCVVVLDFKMGRQLRCRCALDVSTASGVGQYFVVAVDGHGFEDCGICTAVVPMSERHTLNRQFGHSDQGTILRIANADDCNVINEKLPDLEEHALGESHQLIHFLHLPFVCVDAEYTFDMKGCKIFYSLAPQQCTSIIPNVSRLQRELSFKLRCKVILEQVRHQN